MAMDSIEKAKQQMVEFGKGIVDTDKETHEKIAVQHSTTSDVLKKIDESRLNDIQMMAYKHLQMEKDKNDAIIKMAKDASDMSEKQRADIINGRIRANELTEAKEQEILHPDMVQKATGSASAINSILESMGVNVSKIASGAAVVQGIFLALNQMDAEKLASLKFMAMTGTSLSDVQNTQFKNWFETSTFNGPGGAALPKEEALKISAGLMSIPGMDPNEIWGGQKLASVAAFESRGSGLDSASTIQMFREMIVNLDVPVKNVKTEFENLVKTANALGDAERNSIDWTLNLAKSMRAYNLDVDTASHIVRNFYGQLESGDIALSDIGKLMSVGTNASDGQRAFIGQSVLMNNPEFSQFYKGENGFGASEVTKRIMSAAPLIGFEGGDLNKRRLDALALIMKQAKAMVPGGSTPEEAEALTRMNLQTISGLNFSNLRPDEETRLWSQMKGGTLDGQGQALYGKALEDPATLGREISEKQVDWLEKITNELMTLTKIMGQGVLMIASIITGHEGDAADYMRAIKTEGTAMMGEGWDIREAPGDKVNPRQMTAAKTGADLINKYLLSDSSGLTMNAEHTAIAEYLANPSHSVQEKQAVEYAVSHGHLEKSSIDGLIHLVINGVPAGDMQLTNGKGSMTKTYNNPVLAYR
jgi:hypothetical protein